MQNWEELKQVHLQLSTAAAAEYDEMYAQSNFATGIYMRYEEDLIDELIAQIPEKKQALVLGSGTGRETFALAARFEKVFGLDFCPEMTRQAKLNQDKRQVTNAHFMTLDVENDPLPFPDASIDFVNSSFGMGSFVLNPAPFFQEIRRVLKPEGKVIFSFYNSQAFVNQLELGWAPAIASRLNHQEETLEVNFQGKTYNIPVVPYSVAEIRTELLRFFHIRSISTFPSISSIFPQQFFNNDRVRQLCLEADLLLANNLDLAGGPFIVAVVEKYD